MITLFYSKSINVQVASVHADEGWSEGEGMVEKDLWEAALLVDEGDDVEWFCCQKVQDLLVVCELNVLPPDVLLVVLRLQGESCDVT